jgi:hypothetical protein
MPLWIEAAILEIIVVIIVGAVLTAIIRQQNGKDK